ncbi:MAG: SDR family NAD(P)-dependent oxidoreductase [Bacteroidota bacterium]
MKQYFITGTSSGIGKALAEQLIPHHKVTGYSRNTFFSHRNYSHITIDLSDEKAVSGIQFSIDKNADEYILINNAGMTGEIKRVGGLDSELVLKTIHLNLSAPVLLCNSFLRAGIPAEKKAVIINISSGAAVKSIASWATYCATKSALDRFTDTLSEELKETGKHNIRAFSVHPGIVDTAMQVHIRKTDPSDFSSVERFRNYKNEGSLMTAGLVAERIIGKFNTPELPHQTILDIRDF